MSGTTSLINGDVAGIDTLGGVFANEAAFTVAFGVPIMAVALVGRATRRDEAAGLLELLLSSSVGRQAPLAAAVLVVTAAMAALAALFAMSMVAYGAASGGSLLFGLGTFGVGLSFVGVTAIAAQLVEDPRGVWGIGLAATVASYLLRGVGAAGNNALRWLSPAGWNDEARAFGEARVWPALIGVVVGAALIAVSFVLQMRRDVDSAFFRPRRSAARLSRFQSHPLGFALARHRGTVLGWTIGVAAMMGVYGSFAEEVLSAIEDNPDVGDLLGTDPGLATDALLASVMSSFLLMLAALVSGYAIGAVGSLHRDEAEGRLELRLAGRRSRASWLGTHLLVIGGGVLVIGAAGALALGAGTSVAMDDSAWLAKILGGALAFLPSVLLLLGLAVLVFGWRPGWRMAVWGVFALSAVVGFLGPGLGFPAWLVDNSPYRLIGSDVIAAGVSRAGVVGLAVVASAAVAGAFATVRRRAVPTVS